MINAKGICIPLRPGAFDEFYKNGDSVMEYFCSPSTSFMERRLDEDTVLLGFYLHGEKTVKIIRKSLDSKTFEVTFKFRACENLLNLYQAVINAVRDLESQELEIKKIIDNYVANIDPNCTDLDIVRSRFMSSDFFDSKSVMHCEIVALATKCLHDIKSNQANFTQNFYQNKY